MASRSPPQFSLHMRLAKSAANVESKSIVDSLRQQFPKPPPAEYRPWDEQPLFRLRIKDENRFRNLTKAAAAAIQPFSMKLSPRLEQRSAPKPDDPESRASAHYNVGFIESSPILEQLRKQIREKAIDEDIAKPLLRKRQRSGVNFRDVEDEATGLKHVEELGGPDAVFDSPIVDALILKRHVYKLPRGSKERATAEVVEVYPLGA